MGFVVPKTRGGRRHVPPGGPSTINGVLYQLLWSLFEISNARIEAARLSADGAIQELTVALEPASGGDLRRGRRIDQLKARSQARPWSLKEVIEKVIPDLYAASREAPPDAVYRFVTEGKMGKWRPAYEFFRSFGKSPDGPSASRGELDDTKPIFRAPSRSRFWKLRQYTERTLYDVVVEQVRKRKAIRVESADETFKKLQRVLGAFEFVGGQTEDDIRQKIDRALLGFVDSPEDVPNIRKRMLGDLLSRARNQQKISGEAFFADYNLNGLALTNWTSLRDRAREQLAESSSRWLYEADREARPDMVRQTLDAWTDDATVMLLHGESGHGKSWLACSVAKAVFDRGLDLVLMIGARGDADRTVEYAASRVQRDILGRSYGTPSLRLIGDHIRHVRGRPNCRWLMLVIDDVHDKNEATQLLRQPWAIWGVRAVITCPSQVLRTLGHEPIEVAQQIHVGAFTDRELGHYLQRIIGDNWLAMEDSVRNPLRTPIIADTFRQVVERKGDKTWRPQNEYEIFQQLWKELEDEDGGIGAIEPLVRLAIEGRRYPWDDLQLRDVGVTLEGIRRLKKARWLHATLEDGRKRYAVPHERLLSWAVAEILVSDLSHGKIDAGRLGKQLSAYLFGEPELGRRWLGYVAMDALWITITQRALSPKVASLLEAMEPEQHRLEVYYEELIPTLGGGIIPFLLGRLRKRSDDRVLPIFLLNAIIRIGGDSASAAGLNLLRDDNSDLKEMGVRVLKRCPTSDAIPDLWALALHLEKTAIEETVKQHEVSLALGACVRLNPAWVDEAIESGKAEPDFLHKLVWLIHGLPLNAGVALWRKHNTRILAGVLADHASCIGACFGRFREASGADWLIKKLSDPRAWIAAAALRGLVRVSPLQAIRNMHRVPERELYLWRASFADSMLHVNADKTRKKIRLIFERTKYPWRVAEIYQGREQWVDGEMIDLLLDRLAMEIEKALSENRSDSVHSLLRPLEFVAGLRATSALRRFREIPRFELVRLLVSYLRKIGPAPHEFNDGTGRNHALEILRRIDRNEFTKIAESFLGLSKGWSLSRAIHLATRSADRRVIDQLLKIAADDKVNDGSEYFSSEAVLALADFGEWGAVLAFVERVGLSESLMEWPLRGVRPGEGSLEGVRQRAARQSVGAIRALGFGQDERDRRIVRQVLAEVEPGSEAAFACVLSLHLMNDQSPLAVPLLRKQLQFERTAVWATNALMANGSAAALEALLESPSRHDPVVSRHLIDGLGNEAIVEAVRASLSTRCGSEGDPYLMRDITYLVINCERAKKILLEDRGILEFIWAAAYAPPRSLQGRHDRVHAVRCLIEADRADGIRAARAALKITGIPGRQGYPHILMEADSDEAVPLLLDRLADEPQASVKASIGRALSGSDTDCELARRLSAEKTGERVAACFAAGWAGRSEDITARVRRLMTDDPEPEVNQAAITALNRIVLRRETTFLAQQVLDADNEFDRWLYLDSLLNFADPGDEHSEWPVEGPAVHGVLSPLQSLHAKETVKRRREALAKKQDSDDRMASN